MDYAALRLSTGSPETPANEPILLSGCPGHPDDHYQPATPPTKIMMDGIEIINFRYRALGVSIVSKAPGGAV
jgi:hypothetical protein